MKSARHSMILELIDQYDINTQDELASMLNDRGVKVTQATVIPRHKGSEAYKGIDRKRLL